MNPAADFSDRDELLRCGRELAPWHFDMEIAPGLMTSDFNQPDYDDPEKRGVSVVSPEDMSSFFTEYFPSGLRGKTLVDVGCNAGVFCYMAAELGADLAFGLEVRPHWLRQAEFLRQVRYADSSNVRFGLVDVQAHVERDESFDITIFKGVLYHLPDPIHVLTKLAAATREVILVDSDSDAEIPERCWAPIRESPTRLMSGVDGFAWLPGGPEAVIRVLKHVGFRRFKTPYWFREVSGNSRGRFRVIASR